MGREPRKDRIFQFPTHKPPLPFHVIAKLDPLSFSPFPTQTSSLALHPLQHSKLNHNCASPVLPAFPESTQRSLQKSKTTRSMSVCHVEDTRHAAEAGRCGYIAVCMYPAGVPATPATPLGRRADVKMDRGRKHVAGPPGLVRLSLFLLPQGDVSLASTFLCTRM